MGRRIVSLLVLGLLLPACKFSGFSSVPGIQVVAQMRGSQVVPSVATPVTTTNAVLSISTDRTKINYSVTYTGSGTITAVEIRLGVAGANGPMLFTLATAPFVNPLEGTLTANDLFYAPAFGITMFAIAVDRILNGETYLLVSTGVDPTGEMRGQLGAATLASAVLSGGQVTPAPVAGSGTGTFTAAFDGAQSTITTTLTFSGLTNPVTAAHIHFGAAGAIPGPAIFDLSLAPFTSPLVVTLTLTDFHSDPSVPTFADAIDAFLSGLMYVDIHAAPEEIRGQIGPAHLKATMTPGAVAPPVVNAFTGTGNVVLNATQTEALVLLTHDVLAADSVQLCTQDPTFNGAVLYDVDALAGSAANPLQAILNEAKLIPSPPDVIETFPEFVNALLRKKTYLEVRSPSFPSGAIRGQIIP